MGYGCWLFQFLPIEEFPSLVMVSEHLKKIVGKSHIFRRNIHFVALNDDNSFLGEYFKNAKGALVVSGAVVGNQWP